MKFDKLLFINDVVFDAKDAADLLFATNIGPDGKTQYHAACAMDFINPFKFYDTFATRDAEGYRTGVPIFPWFSTAGNGYSRRDVQLNSDAVRVKACWGGMVAFEAKWFAQKAPDSKENAVGMTPITFRATDELFWDSSECCLVHADLAAMASIHPEPWKDLSVNNQGIYINPYIRVAYDTRTHSWLAFTRRFERLYSLPQSIINWLAGRPGDQSRRALEPGIEFDNREWVYDGPINNDKGSGMMTNSEDLMMEIRHNGHWETIRRHAEPGGFCGTMQLLVLKKRWERGERIWERIGPPPEVDDH
jgi:hypothetical protein